MSKRPCHVLVLCTGNSVRSIMGEALLNHLGRGRFHAFSAGSHPRGAVHPLALTLLEQHGLPTADLRSKSWDEFSRPDSPAMDLVITVCDAAANEVCPVWSGVPVQVHWGLPDPARVRGSEAEQRQAFQGAYERLEARIKRLVALDDECFDSRELADELLRIHRDAAA
ncbi:MAG: arsenate reductase ArsC [Nevskiales bacterium]|nr:arsenate reductase ArsC [Nevskiales bacterium]